LPHDNVDGIERMFYYVLGKVRPEWGTLRGESVSHHPHQGPPRAGFVFLVIGFRDPLCAAMTLPDRNRHL
jgi:hypothetical protein